MTDERVIELMKAEVRCIERQDTEACKRNREHTCINCDLVQDTDELLDAYDKVIALLNKSLIRKRHMQEVFEEARAEINAEREE
jgi:hypothetical protein